MAGNRSYVGASLTALTATFSAMPLGEFGKVFGNVAGGISGLIAAAETYQSVLVQNTTKKKVIAGALTAGKYGTAYLGGFFAGAAASVLSLNPVLGGVAGMASGVAVASLYDELFADNIRQQNHIRETYDF